MIPSSPAISSRRAFTLIELLVVISILAILMTLLFPAADAAFETARRTQAKNDATQISNAINAYLAEYGKVPLGKQGDTKLNGDAELVNVLAGTSADETDNPRGIVFLEVPRAKNGKNGAEAGSGGGAYTSGYKDPWRNEYIVYVDGDYDNEINVGEVGGTIRKSVIVYSKGNPKKSGYKDSDKWIKSWD